MEKYSLVGIDYPGTVDLPKLGKVNLEDLPVEKLDELYKNGIPFLQLDPWYREAKNPNEPVINTPPTPVKKSKPNKKPA